MYKLDMNLLEELLGDPVAEIVLRRMLLGFEGTVEQLARNVELDYNKYGDAITPVLEKLVQSRLATKRSYAHQDTVYSSIPDIVKKQVFEDERFRKLKETGFIDLRARLK